MSYLKIYAKTEIDTGLLIPNLQFDYKREDIDSDFYPEPTYEYIYSCEEEPEEEFLNNVHFIYGALDKIGVKYLYDIENAEYRDVDHEAYKQGYKSVDLSKN